MEILAEVPVEETYYKPLIEMSPDAILVTDLSPELTLEWAVEHVLVVARGCQSVMAR